MTGLGMVCEGLSFAYQAGEQRVLALRDISLSLAPGSSTALLGPAGSGKSTLLLILRGLLDPDEGEVRLGGVGMADRGYAEAQRSVGLVFQQAERQLFAATCEEDVAFGPRQLGWPPQQVQEAVAEAMERVGLSPALFGRRHPYALSGGEQRRLALAGVLAMRPRALLLDEPFVGLDPAARRDLSAILRGLATSGETVVLATHEVDRAWELCEQRVVLAGGRLAASGAWDFAAGGVELLESHGLQVPTLVELWRRLGRPLAHPPRTATAAAEALA